MIVAVAIVIGIVVVVAVLGLLALVAALAAAFIILGMIGFGLIVVGLALLTSGQDVGGVFVGAGAVLLVLLALAAKAAKDQG